MTGIATSEKKPLLSALTGEFSERALERDFRLSQLRDTRRQCEFLFALTAVISVVFFLVNSFALDSADLRHAIVPRAMQLAVSLGCLALVRKGRGVPSVLLLAIWGLTLSFCSAGLLTVQRNVAETIVFLLPAIFYTTLPASFLATVLMGLSSSAILFAAYVDGGFDDLHAGVFAVALLLMNGLLSIVRARSGRTLRRQWVLARAHRQALKERDVQERRLVEAEAEYRALFENAVVGIYRSSPDGRLLRANPALAHLHGYATETELLEAFGDLGSEWYVDPGRREEWKRRVARAGRVVDLVSEIRRHRTGERVWISETSWTIRGKDGEILYFEGTVIEATERKRLDAEIRHLALSDELTGLPNRRLLRDRLEQASAQLGRQGTPFAVMYLDLDRFKAVNDAFGHSAGDVLLKEAARRLKAVSRIEDTVARIGGDEFALICAGFERPTDLIVVAERILEAFREPFSLEGPRTLMGTSIGIALAPVDGTMPDDLMKKADDALYRAKADGRNTFRFFGGDVVPPNVVSLSRAQN